MVVYQHKEFQRKPKRGQKIKVYMRGDIAPVYGIAHEIITKRAFVGTNNKPYEDDVEFLVVHASSTEFDTCDCDFLLDYKRCIIR